MIRKLAFVPALLAFTLTGCVLSEVPLTSPYSAEPDKKLIGIWQRTGDNEDGVLIVGRFPYTPDNANNEEAVPRGIMSYLNATLGKDGELPNDNPPLLFFTSKIGNDTYLNAFERKAVRFDKKWEIADTRFLIAKYRVQGDSLQMWLMDVEKVRAALANNTIKGRIEAKGFVRPVVLENAMSLAGLLARDSMALFPEKPSMTFVRARLTTP